MGLLNQTISSEREKRRPIKVFERGNIRTRINRVISALERKSVFLKRKKIKEFS